MLGKTPWALLAAGSLAAAVLGYACAANTSGTCAENGTCPPADGGAGDDGETGVVDGASADAESGLADGASDGAADAGPGSDVAMANDGVADSAADADAPICNPMTTPSQDPCIVDDRYGVFVAPTGNDANAGTRLSPVLTIGHAMELAVGLVGRRVFVCAGTYAEKLAVRSSRDGTSVYGGLDCATWSYAASNRVVVKPAQTGYALEVDGLMTGVTFEDIEFDAQDAATTNPGESSIAAFVHGAQNVVLHRVTLVSGNASPGSGGAPGGGVGGISNHFVPAPDGGAQVLDGNSATSAAGGPSSTCACPDGTMSMGGQGSGQNVAPTGGLPSYGGDAGAGAPGVDAVTCGTGGSAQNGADAPPAVADVPGALSGALSAAGWVPAIGKAGSNGPVGQGGGGGGAGVVGNGAGGGGACGGCGGAGGKAGTGGGSSIALLSFASSISLVACTLTAHDAGNGGPAGTGEAGESGGVGGVQFRSGCQGGGGGAGAGGNGAQGGPGGLSIGILYSSTAPMPLPPIIDGTSVTQATTMTGVTTGKAGLGGPRGTGGPAASTTLGMPGADGANGKDGLAQAVVAL
jgi:hypothetical protein